MSDQITCSECGETSTDPNWCDNCGAPLDVDDSDAPSAWLEPGDEFVLETDQGPLRLEMLAVMERFAVRQSLIARTVGDATYKGVAISVEESAEEVVERRFEIPEELAPRLRHPIAEGVHRGRRVRAFPETRGVPLSHLVASEEGDLAYAPIRDIYAALLDAIIAVHRSNHLMLCLSPWHVRIETWDGAAGTIAAAVEKALEARTKTLREHGLSYHDPAQQNRWSLDETAHSGAVILGVEDTSEPEDDELDFGGPEPAGPDEGSAPDLSLDDGEDDGEDDDDAEHEDSAGTEEHVEDPERTIFSPMAAQIAKVDADDDALAIEADDELLAVLDQDDDGELLALFDDAADVMLDEELMMGDELIDELESAEGSSGAELDDAVANDPDSEAPQDDDADDVDDELDDEDEDESGGLAPWERTATRNVKDLIKGADDDEEEEESPTGVLRASELVFDSDRPPFRVLFEGIEQFYPADAFLDQVPVILGFSAPELLGRVRAEVSMSCDVFALGMILHHLIAGVAPPVSVYTRFTPALPARNFRPTFPPGLQHLISRATRPVPNDRYPDVNAIKQSFLDATMVMELRAGRLAANSSPLVELSVDTHVGIAKRQRNPHNQDAVFGARTSDGRFSLVCVADGVSTASYGTGEIASHLLSRATARAWPDLKQRYLDGEPVNEGEVILQILAEANDGIIEYVNEHHTPFGGSPHEVMGSTALLAVFRDGVVTLAALGDSRVYLQRGPSLEQLTIDHNLWTLSILDGVPADNAMSMPHGDALARCLGTFLVEDGNLVGVPPTPDMFRFAVTKGDRLLMTSDGLVDFAGPNPATAEENVLSVLVAESDPALACLELILLANRGGGGDNIGVGILKFV